MVERVPPSKVGRNEECLNFAAVDGGVVESRDLKLALDADGRAGAAIESWSKWECLNFAAVDGGVVEESQQQSHVRAARAFYRCPPARARPAPTYLFTNQSVVCWRGFK